MRFRIDSGPLRPMGWSPKHLHKRARLTAPWRTATILNPHTTHPHPTHPLGPAHPRFPPPRRGRSERSMKEMKLEDLKLKSPTEMLSFAEESGVENASTMRKQELMFATLKQLAAKEVEITGTGVVEVLQDGFGCLRSPDANYLPGPDDIYVSPSQIRRFALRSG